MMAVKNQFRLEYFLEFNSEHRAAEKATEYTKMRLMARGFNVHQDEVNKYLLLVGAAEDEFRHEAEHLQLLKKIKDTGELEEFSADEWLKYETVGANGELFLPHERIHMLTEMIEHVMPDVGFRKVDQKCIKVKKQETLMHACRRFGMLASDGPLHDPVQRKAVWKELLVSISNVPSMAVRNYYGEGVAFYMAWMYFYVRWLIPPGILGAVLWYVDIRPDDVTVDTSPYVPLVAFFMVVWGFVFMKTWERRSAELAFDWDTYDRVKRVELRPSYYGEWRVSEVTGESEVHYPTWKRRCKYVVSAAVTSLLLFVAFWTMVCSLNLQGYVSATSRFGQKNPFHVGFLSRLAEPGAILDPRGGTPLTLIPVVCHAIAIVILNQFIYRRVALKLTEWENHKTECDFENALILKRFLFEAFDCYIALFYLAFYEFDVVRLRSELMALFTTDCIRRVATETLIPLITHSLQTRKKFREYSAQKKDDSESTRSLLSDVTSDPYEPFDDYLEMVIQYGYVMLFASAFPLAAAVSIVTNLIEIKSDSFKLSFVTRRPKVVRAHMIGTWYYVMVVQTWLAVLTNVLIFGFSSQQMMQWFPWLFEHIAIVDHHGREVLEQDLKEGSGRYVVAFVFLLEHVLFVVGLLITFAVASIPVHVKRKMDARVYRNAKVLRAMRRGEKTKRLQETRLS